MVSKTRAYKSKCVLFFAFLLSFHNIAYSQHLKTPSYSVETGFVQSFGRETPFWLISNQYGLVTPNRFNGYVRAGIFAPLSIHKKLDYSYGLEIINRYSNQNSVYLNQGYLRFKFFFFNLQGGIIKEKFGNQDPDLSSGGLLWSGNARPMPEISVIIPKFTTIPFTFGLLAFKGGMTHAWFDNNQFINHAWLHHKYLYLQFGGKLPVHIHYGLHHYAEWAGVTPSGHQLPNNFSDFIKVFFAKGGVPGSPVSDSLNALGNHLGSRNFGLDIDLPNYRVGAYWQTIFEDGSGYAYRNIKDGLWGIYFHSKDKNKLINGILYEFINTTNQSGLYNDYWVLNGITYFKNPPTGSIHHEAGGNDNYFNNGVYKFGWTYHQMTIGTPLITSPVLLHGNQSDYIRNNKITAHHLGIEGMHHNFSYKLFYTYYLNFGTNNYPIRPYKSQQSILVQTYFKKALPWQLDLSIKMGLDIGSMYGNNLGFQFSLIKQNF